MSVIFIRLDTNQCIIYKEVEKPEEIVILFYIFKVALSDNDVDCCCTESY
jgi:hypothetical protein